jgi:hypothetical protein
MDTFVMVMIGAAWAAIFSMLAWGAVSSWRTVWRDDGALPIFGMAARRGLALERLEQAPAFYAAVRRCAMCREKQRCGDWLARRTGGPAPECLNESYFEAARLSSPAV